MNYQRIYNRIVSRAKERKLDEPVYRERHHIIPRCIGGTDDKDNLVDLTPEEHYVCHQLLVKMYPGNVKLLQAVLLMSGKGNKFHERGRVKRNKLYGWLKREIWKDSRKELECEHCHDTFVVPAHKVRRFCSSKCYGLSQRIHSFECIICGATEPKDSRWSRKRKHCSQECCNVSRTREKQSKMLERKCLHCANTFYRLEYCISDTAPGLYCSRSCTSKATRPLSDPVNHITKTCLRCNKEFSMYKSLGFKQYCSKACSKEAKTSEVIVRTCPVCDTSFSRFAHLGDRTFCSLKCAYKGRSSEFVLINIP